MAPRYDAGRAEGGKTMPQQSRDGPMTLYVTEGSGNSFKPALALRQLGIPHRLKFVDVLAGETRQAAFLSINPLGQVPYLVDPAGRGLGESNAMLWYLSEGSALMPEDPFDRATMLRWMFFEQTRLEPYISPARFFSFILPHRADEFKAELPRWRAKADTGLGVLDDHLSTSDFVVSRHGYSIGDIAMFGYVHLAEQAGIDLHGFRHVSRWIDRVTETPDFAPIQHVLDPRGDIGPSAADITMLADFVLA